MDSRRGSRTARQRGNPDTKTTTSQIQSASIAEVRTSGPVPRFEIPDWREQYGVVAGITGRGDEPGRGFDLGLWSNQPVGEVMNRWLAFRRALPDFDSVVLGNQVHGVKVLEVGRGRGWTQIEGIDGWITAEKRVLLTVTVADCVPVYLLVPGRGIALLHAGWRGTAGGILARGSQALLRATSSDPSEVVMHCGIGICGACYEVGSEVMLDCGLAPEGPGPWHIDLREILTSQARALGIGVVGTSSWCSSHDRSHFYSHRASRGQDGRMVAYIGMQEASSH